MVILLSHLLEIDARSMANAVIHAVQLDTYVNPLPVGCTLVQLKMYNNVTCHMFFYSYLNLDLDSDNVLGGHTFIELSNISRK